MGDNKMRRAIGALAALLMLSGFAFAAEAEGHIKKVDRDKMTITLDDGKSYKLPGETDMDGIKEGMDVVLAYDKVDGENLVTDMQTSE
jgi:Cu/Ag efflux protein CusF